MNYDGLNTRTLRSGFTCLVELREQVEEQVEEQFEEQFEEQRRPPGLEEVWGSVLLEVRSRLVCSSEGLVGFHF